MYFAGMPPMRRLTEVVLHVATVLVTAAALTAVAIRVDNEFLSRSAGPSKTRRIAEWRKYGQAGKRVGPSNAVVTIVEFTDFQCPFCRQAARDLQDIYKQFPGRVAIVFRHFPLPTHAFAAPAAQAAECAAKQGAFTPYHDLLFAAQDSIGRKAWTGFAEEARVPDMVAFETCLSDGAVSAAVKQDQIAGRTLGILGTPTFLINELEVSGYPGRGKLLDLVRLALNTRAEKLAR